MKTYQEQNNLAILPLVVFEQQKKLQLTDSEVVVLIKLHTLVKNDEDITSFIKNQNLDQNVIKSLEAKGLISFKRKNQTLICEINQVINPDKNQDLLNRDAIDRINFLLNRKLKMHELEKINSWLTLDYTIEQIETAITKSMINNVSEFNYIEKVLFNSDVKTKQNINIERNFDLY